MEDPMTIAPPHSISSERDDAPSCSKGRQPQPCILDTDDVILHIFSYCDFSTMMSARCAHRHFHTLSQHRLLHMERDMSNMLYHNQNHNHVVSCSSHNADPDPSKGEMYHSCHIQLKAHWTFDDKASLIDRAVRRYADPGMFVSLEGMGRTITTGVGLGTHMSINNNMDYEYAMDVENVTDEDNAGNVDTDADASFDPDQPSVQYNAEYARSILAWNDYVNVYHFLPMTTTSMEVTTTAVNPAVTSLWAYPMPDQVPPLSSPLGWEIRVGYDDKDVPASTAPHMSVSDAWHMIQNDIFSNLQLRVRAHQRIEDENNIRQMKQYILCLLLQSKLKSIRCCYITYDYQCYDCPAGGTQRYLMFETSDGYPVEICSNVHYSVPGFNTPHAVL